MAVNQITGGGFQDSEETCYPRELLHGFSIETPTAIPSESLPKKETSNPKPEAEVEEKKGFPAATESRVYDFESI